MSLVIYKYPIKSETEIELPASAKVLTIQVQHGGPQIWVLLDPEAPKITRRFVGVPTGKPFEEKPGMSLKYIGTFQLESGYLVFHLFEVVKPAQ